MSKIIERAKDVERVEAAGPWIYIFGRRKTGKTFFVKNFLKYDDYFFVKRDRSVIDGNGNSLSFETFFEIVKRDIGKKRLVIDEFHRLPEGFFDYLHFAGVKGNLTAISSTLWYSKKLLGKGSPLIGLFTPIEFGIISETDILKWLLKNKDREIVESAVYLREPLLIAGFEKHNITDHLSNFLKTNCIVIRELIGEIFSEEERELTLVYEGILKAVASGKNVSTEISSYLFSKRLIQKDNPGFIQRYLDVLKEIGLLEKLEVWESKKYRYFHTSPLLDLHFYLDEKYGYTETDTPLNFIKKAVETKLPRHVEKFFFSFFSKATGLKKIIIEEPEIDVALVEFKKIKVVAEVKWTERWNPEEIKSKFESFKDAKKYLIVKDKKGLKSEGFEIIDYKDLLSWKGG